MIPALILALLSFVGVRSLLINENRATFEFGIESKGKAMADFLERISVTSLINGNFSALEDYVKEGLKDPEVAFLVFYDAGKRPLTKHTNEPNDTAALLIQEREIRTPGENGKLLGYLKLGYNRTPLSNTLHSGILTGIIGMLILFTLLIVGAMILIRTITQPLDHFIEIIGKVAQGDLTAPIEPGLGRRGDVVGRLAQSFAKMLAGLSGIIKKVQDGSYQATDITEQGLASAREISESANHQAEASAKASSLIEKMNILARKIAENLGDLSYSASSNSASLKEMGVTIVQATDSTVSLSTTVGDSRSSLLNMSSTIKEVAGHIDTLLLYAEDATVSVTQINVSIEEVEKNAKESALLTEKFSQEAAELGIGAIEQTIDGMEQIKKTVEKSSYIINRLDERAKKIGDILIVIDGVTRQTNLLALNAAILSAQAGSGGQGFAVVSQEMKSLADRTEASTTEIAQLIRDVQSDATDAVGSVKAGLRSVEEGVRRSDHARESLYKIMEISKRSSMMSRQIEKATLDQVKSTHQMTQLMEKVSIMVMKINTAMADLENETFRVTQASQKMNSLTEQVQASLEKQAKGSMKINDTDENVRTQIQQIAGAMSEQKHAIEIIGNSILEMQRITEVSGVMTQRVSQAMESLRDKTALLKNESHHFKIQSD